MKKCILKIEEFQFVILPWKNLQTCHLDKVGLQNICSFRIKMKTLQCHYDICTLLSWVLIRIFDVSELFWNFGLFSNIGPKMNPWRQKKKQYFTPFIWPVSCDVTIMKTLNCDILSWEHDKKMVDHYLKKNFCHFRGVLLILLATCELGESFAAFVI